MSETLTEFNEVLKNVMSILQRGKCWNCRDKSVQLCEHHACAEKEDAMNGILSLVVSLKLQDEHI